jgi:hypothetical protein
MVTSSNFRLHLWQKDIGRKLSPNFDGFHSGKFRQIQSGIMKTRKAVNKIYTCKIYKPVLTQTAQFCMELKPNRHQMFVFQTLKGQGDNVVPWLPNQSPPSKHS